MIELHLKAKTNQWLVSIIDVDWHYVLSKMVYFLSKLKLLIFFIFFPSLRNVFEYYRTQISSLYLKCMKSTSWWIKLIIRYLFSKSKSSKRSINWLFIYIYWQQLVQTRMLWSLWQYTLENKCKPLQGDFYSFPGFKFTVDVDTCFSRIFST